MAARIPVPAVRYGERRSALQILQWVRGARRPDRAARRGRRVRRAVRRGRRCGQPRLRLRGLAPGGHAHRVLAWLLYKLSGPYLAVVMLAMLADRLRARRCSMAYAAPTAPRARPFRPVAVSLLAAPRHRYAAGRASSPPARRRAPATGSASTRRTAAPSPAAGPVSWPWNTWIRVRTSALSGTAHTSLPPATSEHAEHAADGGAKARRGRALRGPGEQVVEAVVALQDGVHPRPQEQSLNSNAGQDHGGPEDGRQQEASRSGCPSRGSCAGRPPARWCTSPAAPWLVPSQGS